MFFAETLGGLLTDVATKAIHDFIRTKFSGKREVSERDLADALSGFMEKERIAASAQTAIYTLEKRGWVTPHETKSGRSFAIAATR